MKKFLLVSFFVMVFVDSVVFLCILLQRTPGKNPESLTVVKAAVVTPTPFQPVQEVTNTPPLLPSIEVTAEPELEDEPVLVETPEEVYLSEYIFNGIRFDSEFPDLKETVFIIFAMEETSVIVNFVPIIPHNGTDDYLPGLRTGGVYADGYGNISINIHSGCLWNSHSYDILEGELLRRFAEGGNCEDMKEFSRAQTKEMLEKLSKADVYIMQDEMVSKLTYLGADVKQVEEVTTMDPVLLANLINLKPDKRFVVLVTSGRNFDAEPWYSGERWIFVMEDGQQ